MKLNRLVQLSGGTCIKIDNALSSRVRSISFELEIDKKYEDHFSVYNEREQEIEGNVYSDNNRVQLKTKTLSGRTCDILFNINTINMNDGDEISGEISIISNVGMLKVPYKYLVTENQISKTISKFNELTDYYDCLTDNFEFGRKLFSNPEFIKSPFLQDEFTMSLYNSLCKGSSIDIALVEFFKAFDIDIVNLFKDTNDEIIRAYIDDTLDNIELDSIKSNKNLLDTITYGKEQINEEKVGNAELQELSVLIENLSDKELLNVLASMCVRNNYTDEISFKIYLKVIEKGSNITGIYDKFLLSIPPDYSYKLPLYIYRYYYDEKSYLFDDKAKLYENIIATFEENDDVYKLYNEEILEYAISRIYQNRITEPLVKIYKKVLSTNIINENNCNNVLYLLRNHKIIVRDKNVKKIIIRYKETDKETKYDIVNGIAYVPIFFDSYLMLYEDSYGNRYYTKDVTMNPIFDRKDLEKYIIENFEQKDIIDMTKIIKLNEAISITKDYEVEEIRELEKKVQINPVIRDKFKKKIIDYNFNIVMSGNSVSDDMKILLLKLPFDNMDIYYKRKLIKILFLLKENKFVYEKVSIFGFNLMEIDDLRLLFSRCIDINDENNKQRLLQDIFDFTKEGNLDQKHCNYLLNNYEGSIDNMVVVLDALNKLGIDGGYIAKKILINSLECNDTRFIDKAYDNYTTDENDEYNLEVAYLNKKATDYVLDDVETNESFFDKLSNYMIRHFDEIDGNMPIVFLFAMTKYISTIKLLSNNEYRRILIKAMERLLRTDYVFAYYKKLNRHIRIPYGIMNKEYIEYHANKDFVPRAVLSISGDMEKKEIELTKVFMNIYIKKITVFKNEVINYEIINSSDPSSGVLATGTLRYDENYEYEYPKSGKVRGTFDYINEPIVCLDRDNIEGLKKVVTEMVEKQEISKDLFSL